MTREEAHKLARDRFGPNAVVGLISVHEHMRFRVGALGTHGQWSKRGVGDSWEEAFAAVVDVTPGKFLP